MEFGDSTTFQGFGDERDPLWFQPLSPAVGRAASETPLLRNNLRSVERTHTEPSGNLYPWSEETLKDAKDEKVVKGKCYHVLSDVELLDPFGLGIVDVNHNKEPFFVPSASSPSILPAKTPGLPTLTKEPNHSLENPLYN